MTHRTRWLAGSISIVLLAACGVARASDDVERMLAELDAVKRPLFDQTRRQDREYAQQYMQEMQAAMAQRADLIKRLYDAHPEHARVKELMVERWRSLSSLRRADEATQEMQQIVQEKPDSELAQEARVARAQIVLMQRNDAQAALAAIEEARRAKPDDQRIPDLLLQVASFSTEDPQERLALFQRIQTEYPGSRAAQAAEGMIRQATAIGTPFELSFTDAISGKQIDVQKDLKGKVVVVDFWATWCGPCVAEMPNMKKLYAEYKDKGVEFIGVSLDQPEDKGGLSALKEFVQKEEIGWPQYYQGKGWQSDFSSSWGINSIPRLFIVDANGNLHSTEARGQLEQMIPELIQKRDGKTAAVNPG